MIKWLALLLVPASFLISAASHAEASNGLITVSAFIDGDSHLYIQSGEVYWYHVWKDAPGRHAGADEPTYINAVPWYPEWPDIPDPRNRDCHCFSSSYTELTPPLPSSDMTIDIVAVHARGSVSIEQAPSMGNDHTLAVRFNDVPQPGPDWYDIEIHYDLIVPVGPDTWGAIKAQYAD